MLHLRVYLLEWLLHGKMNTHTLFHSHNNKRNNRNAYPHTITNTNLYNNICVSPFIWPGVLLYTMMIKRCRHSKLNRKWTKHVTTTLPDLEWRSPVYLFFDETPVECTFSKIYHANYRRFFLSFINC